LNQYAPSARDIDAARIKQSINSLQTMTRFALAVLALASGVYTYLGVRSLLDGSATQVFFAAIVYSSAVSVGIYAFWTYLMRFFPLMQDGLRRLALLAVMALGSVMIIAMSSWLNAAALAGSAALEQHLAVTLEDYASDLDKAHARALSSQSLLPDVRRASERFKRLAADERTSGSLTGTSGSGSVVQLLTQMGAQLDELAETIVTSRERTQTLFEEGGEKLGRMRTLVSASGPVQPRADEFSEEAVLLAGVIASLQETSIAPSVRRAAEDLSLGFIAPVADGSSEDLASRQDAVMASVKASVDAQSAALTQAADSILAEERVPGRRFVPLSSAEAVLRYASDFAPSWAGAISIDLLPAVLVFMLGVAHAAMRRDLNLMAPADRITAAEMMQAVSIYKTMEQNAEPVQRPEPATETVAPEPAQAPPAPKSEQSVADEADTPRLRAVDDSDTKAG
jgi:hypothetical protein